MEKSGGRLFKRPKLTLSCSAEGKEGRPEREADHTRLVPRLRMVELYFHSPVFLRGVTLNELSTGTTLPLPVILVHIC
jgi:hypothetical protein